MASGVVFGSGGITSFGQNTQSELIRAEITACGRSRYMTGYTWDLAHLHWNCTKLISYWSCRSTVVQFYPQDQRSSIQTPAPSIPTVYHLYCTSLYQTHPFPSKWAAFTTLGHIPDFGSANFPPYLIGTLKVSGTSQKSFARCFSCMSKSNRLNVKFVSANMAW